MIDLDEMEMRSKSMIERGIGNMESGASCYQTIELIERLRQAEKDAARYRWLRNCDTIESKKFVSEAGGWIVGLSVLDGMIDEAMNA